MKNLLNLLWNIWKTIWTYELDYEDYFYRKNHNGKFNLKTAMTDLLGDFSETTEVYPLRDLPNVRTFKVKVKAPYHPIFKKKGILKRQFEPLLESEPYNNKSLNRYLKHQFIRLNKARSNPKLFWKIGTYLMKRSVSYRVYCMNHVIKNWHRKHDYGYVWRTLMQIEKIYKTSAYPNPINYKTKWIQEKTKERPLGIPTPSWRIILHSLQNILVVWQSPYSCPSQHGFKPNKGTDSAWKEILEKVIESENIYEFDLKKYFDTISIDVLSEILTEIETPTDIVTWIERLNRSLPTNHEKIRPPLTWKNSYQKHLARLRKKELLKEGKINCTSNPNCNDEEVKYKEMYGFPQGSPTSPILSNLVLDKLLLYKGNIVQYADDGIIYNCTSPEKLLEFPPESGIEVNWEKSRWIKKDGTWLLPLKFLGRIHIPKELSTTNKEIHKACTRKGSTLELTDEIKNLITEAELWDLKEMEEYIYITYWDKKSKSWKRKKKKPFIEWFKTKYYGFISNRLYSGSWDIGEIQQDFSYHFVNWSWSDLENKRRRKNEIYKLNGETIEENFRITTFNSSSFACRSLANRLKHWRKKQVA
jgi:hypothetical protein